MRRGAIVARGPTAQVMAAPQHPYTSLLLASLPRPGWDPHAIAAQRNNPDIRTGSVLPRPNAVKVCPNCRHSNG